MKEMRNLCINYNFHEIYIPTQLDLLTTGLVRGESLVLSHRVLFCFTDTGHTIHISCDAWRGKGGQFSVLIQVCISLQHYTPPLHAIHKEWGSLSTACRKWLQTLSAVLAHLQAKQPPCKRRNKVPVISTFITIRRERWMKKKQLERGGDKGAGKLTCQQPKSEWQ